MVLRRLVASVNRRGGQNQFNRCTRPGNLAKNFDAIMYGLKIYPVNERALTYPWIGRVPEILETPEGNQIHRKEAAAQWSLGIPRGDQEGVSTAGAQSCGEQTSLPTERDKRVEEFF